jgi:microcystin-dependent protein
LAASTLSYTGGNQAFSIVQPSLALNYIIAVEGMFPSPA